MAQTTDLRRGSDRRGQARGGRRPADIDGLCPLIMVVGDHAAVGDAAGAVLAKLKFAVAPTPTVEDALKILVSLRPDLIVAREEDAARIRLECPENRSVLAVTTDMRDDPHLLIEEIRAALRAMAN
jgi:CheY-like chemotaxis protein